MNNEVHLIFNVSKADGIAEATRLQRANELHGIPIYIDSERALRSFSTARDMYDYKVAMTDAFKSCDLYPMVYELGLLKRETVNRAHIRYMFGEIWMEKDVTDVDMRIALIDNIENVSWLDGASMEFINDMRVFGSYMSEGKMTFFIAEGAVVDANKALITLCGRTLVHNEPN